MAQDVAAAVSRLARDLKAHRTLTGDSGFIAHHAAEIDQLQVILAAVRRRLQDADRYIGAHSTQMVHLQHLKEQLEAKRETMKQIKELAFAALPGTRLQAVASQPANSELSSLALSDRSASHAASHAASPVSQSARQPLVPIQTSAPFVAESQSGAQGWT
jgi:hypothetical protein